MKKLIALTLAGAMACSMPVMAAGSPSSNAGDIAGSSSSTASAVASTVAPIVTPEEYVARPTPEVYAATPAPVVEASSVDASIVAAAAEEGKTIGEYMNNAVTTLPGLTDIAPLGQGGHVIINGVPSNQTFSVLKPTSAQLGSAKAFASALGGKILNVAQIKASVSGFNTATVNFYLKGTKAGQNVKVYQLVNGQWLELTVTEIREDHVVVDMTSLGTLAFIEAPVQ